MPETVTFNTKDGRSNRRGLLLLHYVLEGETDLEVERQAAKASSIVFIYSFICGVAMFSPTHPP